MKEEIAEALEHFEMRGEKTLALEDLLENSADILKEVDSKDPAAVDERARKYIEIANARYESGNISEHELLFHKCFAIESQVHESRWLNGLYDDVLKPISSKMRNVEKNYGLEEIEYWPLSEAPEEYKILSREYDSALEEKLLETFTEFGADDLRDLYTHNRKEFDDLNNIGRMSIFLKHEKNKLQVLASIYEKEAKSASDNYAFFAASVMLGSAIEARLIVTCMDNEKKVRETLIKMGLSNKQLKSKNPLTWKFDTLIKVCFEAGWIPNFDTKRFTYSGEAMLNFLRKIRNNVHPAAKLKRGDGLVMGQEQYKDISYIHQLLASTLNWPRK